MMKKINLFILSLFLLTAGYSQSIKSYVITSAGTTISGPGGSIYISIGEPINTEIDGGEIMISQGFLNVSTQGVITSTDDLLNELVDVYPNPTSAEIEIVIPEFSGAYKYYLLDQLGKLIQEGDLDDKRNVLGLQSIDSGIYFLNIVKEDRRSRTLKIVKQ